MVSSEEIHGLSKQHGVPIINIEKDYVIGWLLWGIYTDAALTRALILKGGNCLRKVYIPETRFSDDLDFTTGRTPDPGEFRLHLESLCERVADASGIDFDTGRTRVSVGATPDPDCRALDGRVYFKGFAGDSSLTMRIKFDVCDYEKIVLPTQIHPLIHQFSDAADCDASIIVYSLEEVIAEKLRSWIQRTRSRDLFDLGRILQLKPIPISPKNILTAFFRKTIYKDIPFVAQEEMLHEGKFDSVQRNWLSTLVCPRNVELLAGNCMLLFRDLVRTLFSQESLDTLKLGLMPKPAYLSAIPSEIREPIVEAGKARKLVRLRYKSIDRTIEPYSFRYKLRKGGGAAEYFYGYDRSRGKTIKSFFLHKVQAVSIVPTEFQPRWVVEF